MPSASKGSDSGWLVCPGCVESPCQLLVMSIAVVPCMAPAVLRGNTSCGSTTDAHIHTCPCSEAAGKDGAPAQSHSQVISTPQARRPRRSCLGPRRMYARRWRCRASPTPTWWPTASPATGQTAWARWGPATGSPPPLSTPAATSPSMATAAPSVSFPAPSHVHIARLPPLSCQSHLPISPAMSPSTASAAPSVSFRAPSHVHIARLPPISCQFQLPRCPLSVSLVAPTVGFPAPSHADCTCCCADVLFIMLWAAN